MEGLEVVPVFNTAMLGYSEISHSARIVRKGDAPTTYTRNSPTLTANNEFEQVWGETANICP